MAKSLRSKREKRLKAIRRDLVQPLVNQKDAAKLAAQEAALAAPKLPVRLPPPSSSSRMELVDDKSATVTTSAAANNMDVEMDMNDGDKINEALKPKSQIGKKKSQRKFKVGKGKNGGKRKFKITKRHI